MAKIRYGGQAVIEGVMMQGPKGKAIACRKADGEIVYRISEISKPKPTFWKMPIIRGFISFLKSFKDGLVDLTWSAAQTGDTEDEKLSFWDMLMAIVLALVLAVVIFIALPVFAATILHPYIGDFGRSLLEGVLRIILFVGYILLISRMDDIKRLFAYHGAEHKTINAYEAGAALTPESVANRSRLNCRCGTSFVFMALLLMIFIFTFVGQTTAIYRILIKIALMPVVAGLAYEIFRLPLYFPKSIVVKILIAPGMWLQRLTTREPDASQIAVAIAALKAVPGFSANQMAEQAADQNEQTIVNVLSLELPNKDI